MNRIELTDYPFSKNRKELRKQIISIFLDENPGTGKGDLTSRYNYIVKKKNNNEVFLKRPAQFNNGFDFTLNVTNINFNPSGRSTTRPTHGNILEDLELKKKTNEKLYSQLKAQIDKIYNCQNPDKVIFDFGVGLDSEILLECVRWLFIEQDVTYWNYSGRAMFYESIKEI